MKNTIKNLINPLLVLILACLFFSSPSLARNKYVITPEICKNVNRNIEEVNEKLREGYSSEEGEVLKKRLRKFIAVKHSCRRKGLPVGLQKE